MMTAIVNTTNTAFRTAEEASRILKQVKDMDDFVVLVASAPGSTTNDMDNFLQDIREKKNTTADNVLGGLDRVFNFSDMEGSLARGYYSTALADLRQAGRLNGTGLRASSVARMHLYPEKISAAALFHIAVESGIDALWFDFDSAEFPLMVKGDYNNARIDLEKSRAKAGHLMEKYKTRMVIVPGYGGVEIENGQLRVPKTLGRGPGKAALGHTYAFEADNLWVLIDSDGIYDSQFEKKTVGCIDMAEAKDASILGVPVPGRKALEISDRYAKEGKNLSIYVAHGQNMQTGKTEVVRKDEHRMPVKLVSGDNIILYELEGYVKGLQSMLAESGIGFGSYFSDDHARVVVRDDNARYVDRMMQRFKEPKGPEGPKVDVDISRLAGYSIVGAVGGGMYSNGSDEAIGVGARATQALSNAGVGFRYSMDPGLASMGFVIRTDKRTDALGALYREFLRQPK